MNATLPKSRKPSRAYKACATRSIHGGHWRPVRGTHWSLFASEPDGYCAVNWAKSLGTGVVGKPAQLGRCKLWPASAPNYSACNTLCK